MTNKYNINTISQYLEIIRENNFTEFVYRGQNEPYYGIQASGFRPYKGSWREDQFYDISTIQKEYYNMGELKLL